MLTSSLLGRMAVIEWCVDGQSLGELGCDGVIVASPTGSTAYNLSAGGPVLAWGTDGFVVTFVSPHSLHARSMVLGRAHVVQLHNRSPDVPVQVIVDGHTAGPHRPGRAARGAPVGVERMPRPSGRVVVLPPLPGDRSATELRRRGRPRPRPYLGQMLLHLHIENLALIERADLEPAPGLNVLTGETGAGKTMLAEAIGLLAGAPAAGALIGPHADEAYVEAEFELPDGFFDEPGLEAVAGLRPSGEDTLVVARRLLPSGRSRALVWGRTCARADLEALGERLLEVSSQHEARRLAQPSRQLELLDAHAGCDTQAMAGAWRARRSADAALEPRPGPRRPMPPATGST